MKFLLPVLLLLSCSILNGAVGDVILQTISGTNATTETTITKTTSHLIGWNGSGTLTAIPTPTGTLTSFSATDSTGIDFTVTNPTSSPTLSLSLTSAAVGLSNVENTALSTWAGSTNISQVGTITTGNWLSTVSTPNAGLSIQDAGGEALTFNIGEDLTVARQLTLMLGDADRSLTISGDVDISGTNTGDLTLAGSPNYLTLSNQVLTRSLINLSSHVTGTLPVLNGGTGLTSTGTAGNVLTATSSGTWVSATPSASGITALTGDVTASGSGSVAATIANDAVTFAKMANLSASRLIGRTSASSGDPQEITLGSGLAMSGTQLAVVGYNPFDQNLNTTDAVEFPSITLTNGNIATGASLLQYTHIGTQGDVPYFSVKLNDGASDIGETIIGFRGDGAGSGTSFVQGATGDFRIEQAGGDLANVYALTFTGTGSNLTALNAANISSGTLATARLPTVPVASGGTSSTTLTANAVLLGNGTSALQTVAPSTSGNVLTSNGTTWTSAAPTTGANPAGSGSELQFRSTGTAFGALTSSSVSGANLTLGGLLTVTPAAANTGYFSGTGYSLTGSDTTAMLNLAGTWNTTGIANGIRLDVTDTASNSNSYLMHLTVGGANRIRIFKNGDVFAAGNLNGGILSASNYFGGGDSGQFILGGSLDTRLQRDAAAVWAMRNGTNAHTLRLYDTFASASDYHRLGMATVRISQTATAGATITLTGLIPDGAVVMGVTTKVTTALTGGVTGYQIGTGADPDRWGVAATATLGTTTDNRDWTNGTIECFTAATDVILTATGANFSGTGVIYVSIQYMRGESD